MAGKGQRAFVVIGLGTFGKAVATELVRLNNDVLGIDIDEGAVNSVVDTLTHALIADARDEEALKEAGAGDYDVAVVAIGEDLEASILATINAKMAGVETVWVKAISRTHHRILSKLGADRVIEPEQEIARHVAQHLDSPFLLDYVALGNHFYIVNVSVPEGKEGDSVASLELGDTYDLRCLGLMRGSDFVECGDGDTVMQEGDRLIVLGRRDNLRRFGNSL